MFEKAFITGASSGIGESLAKLLSSKGIRLILSGRNQSKLEEIARITHAEKTILAHLDDAKERQCLIDMIQKDVPDLVINNAGFGIYGELLSSTLQEQVSIVEVNAVAPLEITMEAARAMIAAQKKGVIINISSVAGEHPTPGMSVYGASKSFLTMFSRAFQSEVKSKGIDVLVCCPGMVSTNFALRAARKKVELRGPVMTPDFVAQQVWRQIENRKEKRIINWVYRWSSTLARYVIPESFVKNLIWKKVQERL